MIDALRVSGLPFGGTFRAARHLYVQPAAAVYDVTDRLYRLFLHSEPHFA